MAVPPTPALPRIFADESLLLETEPDFGDVSLGEDWEEGESPTTRHVLGAVTEEAEDDFDEGTSGCFTYLLETPVLSGRGEKSPSQTSSLHHARQQTPARDDYYARRVSPSVSNTSPAAHTSSFSSMSDKETARVHLAWKDAVPARATAKVGQRHGVADIPASTCPSLQAVHVSGQGRHRPSRSAAGN